MEHSRKQKLLVVLALVVAIASLSVGFAAFSTTLNISSSASVTPSSSAFSVKFSINKDSLMIDEVVASNKTEGIISTNGVIDNSGNPVIRNLSATFTQPGQFVEYTFYIRNEGEYTAYFNTINFIDKKVCMAEIGTSEELVKNACDFINMDVVIGDYSYNTGAPAQGTTALDVGKGIEARVRIEYSASGPSVDGAFSITFPSVSIVYSSVDDYTLDSAYPNVLRLDSGDLNTPGSIVSIGNEKFYVFGQENGNVKLLSMYNLHVGNLVYENNAVVPITNPSGVQYSEASGNVYDSNAYPYIGTTAFSVDGSVDYVGSTVEGYVNTYRNYLEGLGANISAARLITSAEVSNLGAEFGEQMELEYKWLYSTSYWTMTAYGEIAVACMYRVDGGANAWHWTLPADYNYFHGVRPVIEIPLSEFK